MTLLMKDVFDVASPRMTSTVVLANISPLARDVGHSANTLSYASPWRVAISVEAALAASGITLQKDVRDPALWDTNAITQWILTTIESTEESVATLVVNGLNGVQFCSLPEPEIFKRCNEAGLSKENASKLYGALWSLIVDAKVASSTPHRLRWYDHQCGR